MGILSPKEFVGDAAAMGRAWGLGESLKYTRALATAHYENFNVVSFLLPGELHQDFYNVYAFCRWADDLGDEMGDTGESLRLLGWWRGEMELMYAGKVAHPVFVALQGTVEKHGIPERPFADLLRAFVRDQTVTRYRNWAEVDEYCVYSANPVGHLVLYLCGYGDAERRRLSDATCTGLQLANFWQDVIVDLEKDRVYLPLDLLAKYGYSEAELFARKFDARFGALMAEAVERARGFFRTGYPLARRVNRRLSIDLELFSRGGMCILDKIEQQGFDVLSRRPKVGKVDRVRLLAGALVSAMFPAKSSGAV